MDDTFCERPAPASLMVTVSMVAEFNYHIDNSIRAALNLLYIPHTQAPLSPTSTTLARKWLLIVGIDALSNLFNPDKVGV